MIFFNASEVSYVFTKKVYLEAPQNSAALTAFPWVSWAAGITKQSNPRVSIPAFPYPQQILLSVIAIFPGPVQENENSKTLISATYFQEVTQP